MNTTPIIVPEFITPADILTLDDAKLDVFLKGIREYRMRSYHIFLETEKMKMEIRNEKLRKKLDQHARMLEKEITRLDKVIILLTKRINNIRAVKLEIGDI